MTTDHCDRPLRHHGPALAALIVATDQTTKLVATSVGDTPATEPVENPDAALGLVTGPALLLCAGMAVVVLLAWRTPRRWPTLAHHWWVPPAFAAGAASNLLDRLAFGAVRDFLPTPWMILNVADLAIGAALVGCYHGIRHDHATARRPTTSEGR